MSNNIEKWAETVLRNEFIMDVETFNIELKNKIYGW